MTTSVVFSNATYQVPSSGEINWSNLSNYLIALAADAGVTNIQKQAVRVATTTPVTVANNTDYAIVVDLAVAGPSTVNLPAGVLKQVFVIIDGKGDAATNNITIDPNAAEQINGAATLVLNKNRQGVVIIFDGTMWRVISSFSATGTIVDADVAANAAIQRSKLASGTASHVVINDGTGVMSSEATLAKVRGGTAQDNSLLTFPASGTVATIADIAAATQETTDLINYNFTVDAGKTRNHHHFTLDVGFTATINGSFVSIGPSINNGTIVVNGFMRVV